MSWLAKVAWRRKTFQLPSYPLRPVHVVSLEQKSLLTPIKWSFVVEATKEREGSADNPKAQRVQTKPLPGLISAPFLSFQIGDDTIFPPTPRKKNKKQKTENKQNHQKTKKRKIEKKRIYNASYPTNKVGHRIQAFHCRPSSKRLNPRPLKHSQSLRGKIGGLRRLGNIHGEKMRKRREHLPPLNREMPWSPSSSSSSSSSSPSTHHPITPSPHHPDKVIKPSSQPPAPLKPILLLSSHLKSN